MKSKIAFFLLFGILAGAIGALFTVRQQQRIVNNIQEDMPLIENSPAIDNSPAPVFSLPDLSGNPVRLDDYLGKVVLINFWATWCKPCIEEMGLLIEINREYPEKIIVIGINVGDDPDDIRRFVDDVGVAYPILVDHKKTVGNAYLVIGFPTTVFVDALGIIRERHVGLLTRRSIEQYLIPLGIKE